MIHIERNHFLCCFWRWCDSLFTRPYICDPHEEIYHSAFMIIEDLLLCLLFHCIINAVYQLVVMFVKLGIKYPYLVSYIVKWDTLAICQNKLPSRSAMFSSKWITLFRETSPHFLDWTFTWVKASDIKTVFSWYDSQIPNKNSMHKNLVQGLSIRSSSSIIWFERPKMFAPHSNLGRYIYVVAQLPVKCWRCIRIGIWTKNNEHKKCDLRDEIYHSAFMIIEDPMLCL